MLIRQVFPELPAGVSYTQIQISRPDEEEQVEQLMNFSAKPQAKSWKIGGNRAKTEIR